MLNRTVAAAFRRAGSTGLCFVLLLVALLTLTTRTAGALTSPVLVTRVNATASYGAGSVSDLFGAGALLSSNGNVVVYNYNNRDVSTGTSLATSSQVYSYNRVTNTTRLVSHRAGSLTIPANRAASVVGVSDDGNRILISSAATNLISGFKSSSGTSVHLYLIDMTANTTELVDHIAGDVEFAPTPAPFAGAQLSADGNFVTYASTASNLISGFIDASGGLANVYRYNASTNTNTLVSHDASNPLRGANSGAGPSGITANGSRISIESAATNLVTGFVDSNGTGRDVYLWTASSNTNELASHRNGSLVEGGNGDATGFVTRTGGRVIMRSAATNHVTGFGDLNGIGSDIYDYSVRSKNIFLVSRSAASATDGANGDVASLNASASGSAVLVMTTATNLITGMTDTNGPFNRDAFVIGRAPAAAKLVSHAFGSTTTGASSDPGWGSISADGTAVTFFCVCSNLVDGYITTNTKRQVFAVSVATGTTRLMSGVNGSEIRGSNSDARVLLTPPAISYTAGVVAFVSRASNQLSGVSGGAAPSTTQLYVNTTGL